MRKQLPLLFLLLLPLLALAQNVTVPKNVYFADVHLKISDGAQQEIQKKVDALHRNQLYFQKKVDLADAYFPIIERVFKEEGVPDDFKYLALQESGLIGDAVSTSNAVGYWQFKKEAAIDFNLRMDNVVDERRHITEASRGAAKYFKRSNNNYDNWFTSLLSYYLGYTGVKAYSSPSDKGAKKMVINEKSHPYVITFLAHKIAYDNFVGKNSTAVSLQELRAKPGQSLADIALSTKTDYAELERYNKWLLGSSIPSDKDYYVLVPVQNNDRGLLASKDEKAGPVPSNRQTMAAAVMVKRNGLNALIARPNDTKDKLALQAGISTRKFLRYNDLHNFDPIVAGSTYYIEKKNTSADKEFHVVQPGETMQMISQHYGIRLNYLLFKNRMSRSEVPVPGRVLWLQKRRPGSTPIEVRDLSQKQNIAATTSKSNAAEVAEQPTRETATAPKENIFTRFINSFKRFKKEPEQEVSPAPTSQNQTSPVPVAPKTASETTKEKAEPIPAGEAAKEEKAKLALYPSAKEKATAADSSETMKTEVNESLVKADKSAASEEEESMIEVVEDEVSDKKESSAKVPSEPIKSEKRPVQKSAVHEEQEVKAAGQAVAPVKASPQTNATKHVVKQGETLYAISRMYAVTVNDLISWNKLGDAPIKLGQELLISEPLTTPANGTEQTSTAAIQASGDYHIVVSGETLYQISKAYNVPLQDLRNWNNLADNNIKLGQELRVKAPAEAATPLKTATAEESVENAPASNKGTMYHTVAAGESMYQISRRYGVTIKDIMEWNNKSDFSVSIGEKLLVRKKN